MLNSSWLLAIPWPAPARDDFLLCSIDCFYTFWLWPLWWVEDAISCRFHFPFYKMYDKSIFVRRFLFLKSMSKRYLLKWFCGSLSVFSFLFYSPAQGYFLRAEVIYSPPSHPNPALWVLISSEPVLQLLLHETAKKQQHFCMPHSGSLGNKARCSSCSWVVNGHGMCQNRPMDLCLNTSSPTFFPFPPEKNPKPSISALTRVLSSASVVQSLSHTQLNVT